ncbi:hypothetical protein CH281_12055 [Rhodococcus sp. 06-221-2]|nr:hypothetical protein CH281_12055 [Rhodococcus sp. 06-221-2]
MNRHLLFNGTATTPHKCRTSSVAETAEASAFRQRLFESRSRSLAQNVVGLCVENRLDRCSDRGAQGLRGTCGCLPLSRQRVKHLHWTPELRIAHAMSFRAVESSQ